jgi:two-component system sensor histidine kinase/response regulator
MAEGMDDFLTKPVRYTGLAAAFERLGLGGTAEKRVSDESDPLGLLDANALLATSGGDPDTLKDLSRSLKAFLPVRLGEARAALAAKDAVCLYETAHKLCALLYAFSSSAGDTASALEDHATADQLDKCEPLLARLESIAERLIAAADRTTVESLLGRSRPSPSRA